MNHRCVDPIFQGSQTFQFGAHIGHATRDDHSHPMACVNRLAVVFAAGPQFDDWKGMSQSAVQRWVVVVVMASIHTHGWRGCLVNQGGQRMHGRGREGRWCAQVAGARCRRRPGELATFGKGSGAGGGDVGKQSHVKLQRSGVGHRQDWMKFAQTRVANNACHLDGPRWFTSTACCESGRRQGLRFQTDHQGEPGWF
jgi:hypothetical protein